jgi:hypothetical protein
MTGSRSLRECSEKTYKPLSEALQPPNIRG